MLGWLIRLKICTYLFTLLVRDELKSFILSQIFIATDYPVLERTADFTVPYEPFPITFPIVKSDKEIGDFQSEVEADWIVYKGLLLEGQTDFKRLKGF